MNPSTTLPNMEHYVFIRNGYLTKNVFFSDKFDTSIAILYIFIAIMPEGICGIQLCLKMYIQYRVLYIYIYSSWCDLGMKKKENVGYIHLYTMQCFVFLCLFYRCRLKKNALDYIIMDKMIQKFQTEYWKNVLVLYCSFRTNIFMYMILHQ